MTMNKKDKEFDEQIAKLLEGRVYTSLEISEKINKIRGQYPNVPILRVCACGRVSTKNDEQESSLVTQNMIFHRYCEAREKDGWVLVEEIYDQQSATILSKRKKFLNIVERAKQGQFDILLFKDSKRFSRNAEDFLDLVRQLKNHNVYIVFISEGVNSQTAKRETLHILGMLSESHSNGLHESVTAAMLTNMKREEGRCPSYCFGYTKLDIGRQDSRNLVIDDKEAELIVELFTRLKNREGFSSICGDWRTRGIKTKTGKQMSLHNLRRYARNKIYIGILTMHKSIRPDVQSDRQKTDPSDWITAYRPDLRIVGDDLFYEVQEILDSRSHLMKSQTEASKNKALRNRMFSGIITCGCCGRSFKRMAGGGKRTYNYFGCSTVKDKKKHTSNSECTNKQNIRQDELYYIMSLYFKELLEKQEDLESLVKEKITSILKKKQMETEQIMVSEEEIIKAREKLKRAKELFLEGDLGRSEYNGIRAELKELEDKYKQKDLVGIDDSQVEAMVKKFCNNLEYCVSLGLNEEVIDGVKFNSLFENVVAKEDRSLEINFRIYDSPLVDTHGGGCSNHCLRCMSGCGKDSGRNCRNVCNSEKH